MPSSMPLFSDTHLSKEQGEGLPPSPLPNDSLGSGAPGSALPSLPTWASLLTWCLCCAIEGCLLSQLLMANFL